MRPHKPIPRVRPGVGGVDACQSAVSSTEWRADRVNDDCIGHGNSGVVLTVRTVNP